MTGKHEKEIIMERLEKAQKIAVIATVFSVVGAALSATDLGAYLKLIGFIAGIAAYIYGGFGTAVRMAGKIAKWGWIIAPFPYDIVTLIASFFYAIFVFIFIPIIPIRKAYKESLSYCSES